VSRRTLPDLAAILDLAGMDNHAHWRTAAARTVLREGPGKPSRSSLPLAYALTHQLLEGATAAARRRDAASLLWYRRHADDDFESLQITTEAGPYVVIAPAAHELVRFEVSETPIHLVDAHARPVNRKLRNLTRHAIGLAWTAGFGPLLQRHARAVCLVEARNIHGTLRSSSVTRLPGTVFTDYTASPVILARDLIHEAAHHWLNDALAVRRTSLPTTLVHSPWRGTTRPLYGFLHACFAFSLTTLFAANVPTKSDAAGSLVMADHCEQQRALLAEAGDDLARVTCSLDFTLSSKVVRLFEAATEAASPRA